MSLMEMLLVVCPLAFFAAFVDAIAGGGGLISLPAYFITGMPAHMAIASNKFSAAAGTAIATARFIKSGLPLTHKRITVDGNAVNKKGNYLCPIGTKIEDLLNFAEVSEEEKIIMGGPMMGNAIVDKALPIVKSTNALLAFKGKEALNAEITNCINCARCLGACPMNLRPRLVETAIELKEGADEYKKLNVEYCIECGSCAFTCPGKLPLVEKFREGKKMVKEADK